MQFFAYGEFSDIFKLADSLSTLYFDTRTYCGAQTIHNSLVQHCQLQTDSGASLCGPSEMFKNLSQKHLIDVMGSFGILGELWKSSISIDQMDSDDIFE